ncbi:radical SAM protein [Microbispora bryophytorum]|uniref:radical SAM protein n=1 Tax=Microbispora bryophytorum TaxID=1460882 RepID=UPI0016682152|nr:radical SAM protein [Microbispora bryophytorum]MBD3137341.1 radical SAM protein [Microbispora bryophytorum]
MRRSGQQQARQPEQTAQQPGHSMRQPEQPEQPARQPEQSRQPEQPEQPEQPGRQRGPSVQQSLVGEGPARPRIERQAVTRVFDGITCYEVPARAALERVPEAAELPFTWGASPYRGCEAGCGYCTARRGHRYLGLDPGCDFSTKIVVKTDLARRLRRELDSPRWSGEPVALGLTGDCYQPAEEIYRLMPGVIRTLADAANPFTVLTKSPLVLRDLDLLREAAKVTQVGALVSVGFVDDRLRRAVEPGAATPQRRLEVCATLNEAGIPCGVLMAPILPLIADSTDHLLATVRRAAEAGAVSVTPVVLRLPAGAREWYMGWLEREHPGLVPRYQALYGRGQVAEDGYRRRIAEQVRALAETYGIGRDARRWRRRRSPARQLALV